MKTPQLTPEEINRQLQLLIAEAIMLIDEKKTAEALQILQYANNLITRKANALTPKRLEFFANNTHFLNYAATFLRNTKTIVPLSTINNELLESDSESSSSGDDVKDGKQEKEEGENNNNSSSKKSCNIL